ncbi:MAG: hypothetical protein WDA27_05080 [Actinomycetota bacterium]
MLALASWVFVTMEKREVVMKRKTAVAAGTAVSLTVIAGALAIGANLGLLGFGREPVGQLNPADATPSPKVVTVFVDETPAPVPVAETAEAGSVEPTPVETVFVDETSTASPRTVDDDDDEPDDEREHESPDEHEDEPDDDD